jgi:Cysteine sulfinate desulfinase/cysteine desulfurase and related enzymes
MIYLDYAAHTPAGEAVLEAFARASREYTANPNSPYPPGREAGARLKEAADHIASLLRAQDAEIILTSGASESNNLAIRGVAEKYRKYGRHIISTPLEHASVNGPLAYLQRQGYEIEYAELAPGGTVDIGRLKPLLRPDTVLVSVCWVDSEIGLRQPIERIAALLADRPHCVFHTDATQAVGKIPVSLEGIGLASFAPHKFYGPCGCGVLARGERVALEPQIHGGISASPFRSGTPALALAVAAEKALALAAAELDTRYQAVEALNRRLRDGLSGISGVRINSTAASIPHILNLSIPGVRTDAVQSMLAERGIYVATRSACSAPGSVSRPVYALTHDKKAALSTLRVSLSHRTSAEDIDVFLKCLDECLGQCGERRSL